MSSFPGRHTPAPRSSWVASPGTSFAVCAPLTSEFLKSAAAPPEPTCWCWVCAWHQPAGLQLADCYVSLLSNIAESPCARGDVLCPWSMPSLCRGEGWGIWGPLDAYAQCATLGFHGSFLWFNVNWCWWTQIQIQIINFMYLEENWKSYDE